MKSSQIVGAALARNSALAWGIIRECLARLAHTVAVLGVWIALVGPSSAWAATDSTPAPPPITIPRLERAPALEDFLEMKPGNGLAGKMAKIEDFAQREPKDGTPASQRTEVYLGYGDKNLYVIFVAFDSEPDKIRARMS